MNNGTRNFQLEYMVQKGAEGLNKREAGIYGTRVLQTCIFFSLSSRTSEKVSISFRFNVVWLGFQVHRHNKLDEAALIHTR